ncbi:MAG TPA: sulfotransferase [Gaiellaceae bacterium]|nr:sulfotransferase [Gaiellaceae bacterium]
MAKNSLTIRSQLKRTLDLLLRDPASTGSRPRDLAKRAAFLHQRERWLWSPRRFRSLDSVPLDRPIFMLGVQGGGLTLIAHTLQRHPDVVTMSGNASSWTALNELGVEPTRMRRLPPSLWGCKFRDDIDHPLFGNRHSNVYATPALLPHYRRTGADATAEERRALERLLREHIAAYARDPQTARFLDKTQTYTVSVSFLDELLRPHDPRFLLVVRDPYTMAYRSVRKQPPSFRHELPYEERLRLVAQHWANSVRLALEDGEQVEHFLTVRFEDFTGEPRRVLQEICDFVELDFREDMLPQPQHRVPFNTWPGEDKWYPIRDDPWRAQLSEQEIAIVDESCRELAERFGYAPLAERLVG